MTDHDPRRNASAALCFLPDAAQAASADMKIASFNINNIRKRLPNLFDWLREAEPDAVCLQELKTADAEFPAEAIRQAGYLAVWRGTKELELRCHRGALDSRADLRRASRQSSRHADPSRAWLVVAMASTLAGNFTLVGSVANLIVAACTVAWGRGIWWI
jgi:hypothetical protein